MTRKNEKQVANIPLTISDKFGLIDQREYFTKKIASKNMSHYILLKKGEFAYNKSYSKRNLFGTIARLDNYDMGALSTLYIAFEVENADSTFIQKYYESDKWHYGISKIANEGARNHGLLNISTQDFFNTRIKMPNNLDEQTEIGITLEKLDKIITLEHQRKDRVKALKVALYRHIFGAIENKSAIYFDTPFATWKTYSIDKVIRKSFKGTMKVSDIIPGDTEYLDANRLNGGSPIHCNTKANVNINDILILWDGSNAGKVYKGFNGVLGSTLKAYKIKNEFDSSYIYHYLKWQENKISHSYTTPNIPHVVRDFEEIFKILIPEYKEQVKIGNILNSYDEMLNKYEENIETYQKVKKILLSNLFV